MVGQDTKNGDFPLYFSPFELVPAIRDDLYGQRMALPVRLAGPAHHSEAPLSQLRVAIDVELLVHALERRPDQQLDFLFHNQLLYL